MDDMRRAEERVRYCHKACAPPSGSQSRRKLKLASIRHARRALKRDLRKRINE